MVVAGRLSARARDAAKMTGRIAFVAVAAISLAADLATSRWLQHILRMGSSYQLIGSLVELRPEYNSGVAFGSLSGAPPWLFIALSVLVAAVVVVISFRRQLGVRLEVALGLVIGGALGNAVERSLYGRVYDFVYLSHYPGIFNLADAAITVGVGLLIVDQLRSGPSSVSTHNR